MTNAKPRESPLSRAVFGSDSDDDTLNDLSRVPEIPGLVVIRRALSLAEQQALLQHLAEEGWVSPSSDALDAVVHNEKPLRHNANQAMRFSPLPTWANTLVHHLGRIASHSAALPPHLLARTPLFTQLIVNRYAPGDGLKHHVDLHAFDDGICSVSLESSTVMEFSKSTSAKDDEDAVVVEVNLDPGDVLFLSGAARWQWRHGIAAREWDDVTDVESVEEGVTRRRRRRLREWRTSITLRAMVDAEHTLIHPADDARV